MYLIVTKRQGRNTVETETPADIDQARELAAAAVNSTGVTDVYVCAPVLHMRPSVEIVSDDTGTFKRPDFAAAEGKRARGSH